MSNVVTFPGSGQAILARRSTKLIEKFRLGGKGQLPTFEYLSIELEKLCVELRKKGQRTGVMEKAFGKDFVRMTGRFLAKDGKAPHKIYRTPDAWIRVIRGIAAALDRDSESLIIELLESSPLIERREFQQAELQWLDALEELLLPMTRHLISNSDLPAILEYIARNGLYLEGERLAASEWPLGDGSISSKHVYDPSCLALLPHVSGLNYRPITQNLMDCAPDELRSVVGDLAPYAQVADAIWPEAVSIEVNEGIRYGIALALEEQSRTIEPALFDWHIALLRILNVESQPLATVPFYAELGWVGNFNATPGDWTEASPDNCYKKPDDWSPNGVMFHFIGSPGFERLASELIVRPWVYSDPEAEQVFWSPAHYEVAEEFPTRCPFFTTAGAIEGNLLYAESQGSLESRIDFLLLRKIEWLEKLAHDYRSKGAVVEKAARKSLFEQWHLTSSGDNHDN